MHFFPLSHPRKFRRIVIGLISFIGICYFLRVLLVHQHPKSVSAVEKAPAIPKAFVVASRQGENVTWIQEYLEDWKIFRYVTDNSTEVEFAVPANKGREAMVYLT